MRQCVWSSLAFVCLGAAVAAGQQPQPLPKDREFIVGTSQDRLLDAKLGEQALQRASNQETKKVAQVIVDDSTKAKRELEDLASQRGIKIAQDLEAQQKATLDRLSNIKGAQFDKEYLQTLIKDREREAAELQKAANSLTDPQLKSWAAKTIPTINEQLRLARETLKKVQ